MSTLALTKRMPIGFYENVEYVLRDADGNIKPLFVENRLGRAILKAFREAFPHSIDADGKVKEGLGNHLAAYGLRIPFVTGRWMSKRRIKNLVTDAGLAAIASRDNGAGSEAAFTYIAVGTGTTGAAQGDTTLEAEKVDDGLERAAATASRVTTNETNDTARLVYTFNATDTVAVTESGVLNAASSGVLKCRQTFSAVNVVNGDSLQVTWDTVYARP